MKGKFVSTHTMKAYGKGGLQVYFHSFLTSVLGGGEQSVSRSGLFTLAEKAQVPTE